ncbi:MAG: acyl-CoA dehydrogenase family protein [Chitinophagales bacterium]
MNFGYTDEQESIRRMARKFAENELAPIAQEYDEKDEFPIFILDKLYDTGLLTIGVPAEYGGPGADYIAQALVFEELARGDAGIATTVLGNTGLAADPVLVAGTHEQKERFFGLLNERKIAAFCLTEPGAGSDVSGLATTCKADGDYYILNGTKCFITNAGIADVFVVFVTMDRSLKYKGMCAFMVDRNLEGVGIGKKEHKMGIRTSVTNEVIFDNVRVHKDNLLGKEGEGFSIAMKTLDLSRPMVGAMAIGVAQAAYDYAKDYAQQRVQFGKPIAAFQAIQFMLADMLMQIEAARLLVHKSCWLKEAGLPYSQAASIAKAYAGDMAMKVAVDAVQVLGGYGFTKDYPVEKYMRDAKIMQIYEGTSQIQRMVIANNIFKGL